MTNFRPSLIATMVASALSVVAVPAANASPDGYSSPASTTNINQSADAAGQALVNKATTSGMKNTYDSKLQKATFVWSSADHQRPEMVMVAAAERNAFAAGHYLNALTGMNANKQGNSAKLKYVTDTQRGGIVAKYGQEVGGIEVFNREYNIIMDRDHNLVAGSGYFASTTAAIALQLSQSDNNLGSNNTASNAFGDAAQAIQSAYSQHTGDNVAPALDLIKTENAYSSFAAVNGQGDLQIIGEPRSKKVYFESKGKLVAAHYIELNVGSHDSTESEYYSYVLEAKTNKVLFKNNLTSHAGEFSYRAFANTEAPYAPLDGPHGNVNPADGPEQVDTTVILDASMVTLLSGPISTQDPWLAEDATETIGNNVSAYVDVLAPDGLSYGDYTADVTSAATFDYQLVGADPEHSIHNRKAAIVNLFYLNNYLHDEFYDHGFDEVAGNAQLSNFGRGGEEADPLNAEVQDYSGTNNANMSTPSDGASPRMQMFLWAQSVPASVIVSSHPDVLGDLDPLGSAGFGPGTFDLSGDVVRLADDVDESKDGCEDATNPEALAGKIALIDRGACDFTTKVKNAQNAGAIGVLVANNRDGDVVGGMGGTDASITIPSLMVTQNVGITMDSVLDNNETLTLNMSGAALDNKASSWDNAIVSHEWGHYISNRLVGNASGLSNNQGGSMGEGWGDFHALLTVSSEDESSIAGNELFQKPYAGITYVRSFYDGIRRYPYTTDMEINSHTFNSITDNPAVHASGNVWATFLWNAYVDLINDDRHTYSEARSLMMDYLVAGYKLTPVAPTYTEARDAILAAAYANDVADYDVILAAFARRGMGLGAISPDRESTDHVGVVESYETTHSALTLSTHTLDVNYAGPTSGYCSSDGILDKAETGSVGFTINNKGSNAYTNVEGKIEVTSGHDVTLANDGVVSFGDLAITGSATSAPLEFTLNEAGTGEELTFKVTLPDLAAETQEQEYNFSTTVNYDFKALPRLGKSAYTGAETLAINNDFKENVMVGGERAKGTGGISHQYGDFWRSLGLDVGEGSLFIANNGYETDIAYETKPIVLSTEGNFQVNFLHYFNFEQDFDGGVVEISLNGEPWADVLDVGGQFLVDGYTGSLIAHASQPLPDRMAFTGIGASFEAIRFSDQLNGNTVRFRFRVGSDGGAKAEGWVIDEISFNSIDSGVFSEVIAGDDESVSCDNRLPVVTAGDNVTVDESTAGTLSVVASDPNGQELTYAWTQTSGTAAILTATDTATMGFTAPAVDADEVLAFLVVVSDGIDSVTTTMSVTVTNNLLPLVTAGESTQVVEGSDGTLSVVASDPNGQDLTYAWTQTSGTAAILTATDTATMGFTAPAVDADEVLAFLVVVSDGIDSVTTTMSVTVTNNLLPLVTAGESTQVVEGSDGTLSVVASDPNGQDLTYAWTQTSGTEATLTATDTATMGFTAPAVDADEVLEFSVVVSDGIDSVTSTMSVTVTNVPVVAAAPPALVRTSSGGSTGLFALLLLPLAMLRRRK
jgi:hypothetical protein